MPDEPVTTPPGSEDLADSQAEPEIDAWIDDEPEPPPQQEPPGGGTPQLDAALLDAAKTWGFSEDDAKHIGSDRLGRVITSMSQQVQQAMAQYGQRLTQQLWTYWQQQAAQGQPVPPEQQAEQAQAARKALEKFAVKLSPEDYGELAQTFKDLVEHYHGHFEHWDKQAETVRLLQNQFAQMAQAMQSALQHQAAQQGLAFENWLDSELAKLPQYEPVFGKGPSRALLPQSAEWQARNQLATRFHRALRDQVEAGATQPDYGHALQEALAVVLWGKQEQIARNGVKKEIDARRRQATRRPMQRAATPESLDPDKAAVAYVNRFWADRGREPQEPPDDLDDGI